MSKDSKDDKKAKWILEGMTLFGIFLMIVIPGSSEIKIGSLFLCMAVGYLVGYHPEEAKKVINIIVNFFEAFLNWIKNTILK